MGPRVNGEWAMGNKNRPPAGHAVGGLFVWKGRYPRKKPTEGFIRSKITRKMSTRVSTQQQTNSLCSHLFLDSIMAS